MKAPGADCRSRFDAASGEWWRSTHWARILREAKEALNWRKQNQSAAGRVCKMRYRKSPKGMASHLRNRSTGRGLALHCLRNLRYKRRLRLARLEPWK